MTCWLITNGLCSRSTPSAGEAKLGMGGISAGLHGEDGLDQTSDTVGRLQMADVRLDRPQIHRVAALGCAENALERLELGDIPEDGRGAVGLDEADARRIDTAIGERRAHGADLAVDIGAVMFRALPSDEVPTARMTA